jgi:hypothetical protein
MVSKLDWEDARSGMTDKRDASQMQAASKNKIFLVVKKADSKRTRIIMYVHGLNDRHRLYVSVCIPMSYEF